MGNTSKVCPVSVSYVLTGSELNTAINSSSWVNLIADLKLVGSVTAVPLIVSQWLKYQSSSSKALALMIFSIPSKYLPVQGISLISSVFKSISPTPSGEVLRVKLYDVVIESKHSIPSPISSHLCSTNSLSSTTFPSHSSKVPPHLAICLGISGLISATIASSVVSIFSQL